MKTPKPTKVKIFFLKNDQKDRIFNRFYDSQIIPHSNYQVDEKKRLMYLSTSLQNQKANLSGVKQHPNEFLIPRIFNKAKVNKQQQKQIQYENDEQNQISTLQIESNKKKQTNKTINYNSDSKFNKINLNKIRPGSIGKIKLSKQDTFQQKYYSIHIEDKQKQPKNLAAIVKQNWNKKKMLKNLRKTERTFKQFLLTGQNQQTKKIGLKTQQCQKFNQNNIMLKNRLFEYTQNKVFDTQRQIKYQRSKSTSNSYNNNINNNDNKIVFMPYKYKMNTQVDDNLNYNKKRGRSSNFNINNFRKFKFLQEKIYNQQSSWWSKPQMLKKVGNQFNFKKTIAY